MMRLAMIGPVAALILSQASFLRAQEEPLQKKETVRAFTLKVTGDGRVEMTTKENGEEKTYQADSMDEFRKKYPDVAREYGVGRGGIMKSHSPEEFAKKFEEWRKDFGDGELWSQMPELKKMLEGLRKEKDVEGGHAATPHRLGVRLAPLSQVLADQLAIDVKSAVQIAEIETGSLAEKSGLKKNDVLVRVDGKDGAGMESVRDAVQAALKKKDFDLEILRQGKKQTIKVAPPVEK
jgi:PDZ domain